MVVVVPGKWLARGKGWQVWTAELPSTVAVDDGKMVAASEKPQKLLTMERQEYFRKPQLLFKHNQQTL